jgi:hypothetical protein
MSSSSQAGKKCHVTRRGGSERCLFPIVFVGRAHLKLGQNTRTRAHVRFSHLEVHLRITALHYAHSTDSSTGNNYELSELIGRVLQLLR